MLFEVSRLRRKECSYLNQEPGLQVKSKKEKGKRIDGNQESGIRRIMNYE